jgi:hypothetical protein
MELHGYTKIKCWKSQKKNPKTAQLTHVEYKLLKEVINLISFLIIDFFVVKDLKKLAFLLVSLQLKPMKQILSHLLLFVWNQCYFFYFACRNKNSLIQDPFVPNNP